MYKAGSAQNTAVRSQKGAGEGTQEGTARKAQQARAWHRHHQVAGRQSLLLCEHTHQRRQALWGQEQSPCR